MYTRIQCAEASVLPVTKNLPAFGNPNLALRCLYIANQAHRPFTYTATMRQGMGGVSKHPSMLLHCLVVLTSEDRQL